LAFLRFESYGVDLGVIKVIKKLPITFVNRL